jgi:hypothetical protein
MDSARERLAELISSLEGNGGNDISRATSPGGEPRVTNGTGDLELDKSLDIDLERTLTSDIFLTKSKMMLSGKKTLTKSSSIYILRSRLETLLPE